MITIMLHVSAKTLAQKVTLSAKNATLVEIFNQINSQTGYDFLFSADILKDAKTVTIQARNEELNTVLQRIFRGQPLDFSIENKSVVISKKTEGILEKIINALNLTNIDVTGIVLDEQGRSLPGATAIVKKSGKAIITDAQGQFTLKNVPEGSTIVISFTGYQKQELNARPNLGKINMVLAANKLDAVQVIAYGTTSARLNTGNVTSVSAAEIELQPVTNPLLALIGKVPGLFVAQNSGVPGAPITIQIQGANSIGKGNLPLYVIDGVFFNSEVMSRGSFVGASNPLNYINPGDIESISVLKDGEATSIYGSRAANGAILITTKKGIAGKTRVDFNFQDGFSWNTRFIPTLNTQQYVAIREEAMRNDGRIPSANPSDPGYAPDLKIYDTNRYTNWQKVLGGGLGQNINTSATLSGGSENTQFLVSGTFNKVKSIYSGDFSNKNTAVHMNLYNTSQNKKLKTNFSVSFSNNDNSLPAVDLLNLAIRIPPNAPSLYNADGSLNWALNSAGASTWLPGGHPLSSTLAKYNAKTKNLVGSGNISYNILSGLDISSTFGYTYQQTDEFEFIPSSTFEPQQRANNQSSSGFINSQINSTNIEPKINYKRILFKGALEALAGITFHQESGMNRTVVGAGYSSDLNLADLGAASRIASKSSNEYLYKYAALFARLNYNWGEKYLLNLSARRDGSSRFGSANQFHDFASVGAAWIFSNEGLIKDNLSFLSFGKLKASYGTTGNDQIGNYAVLSSYLPTTTTYQGLSGFYPANLENPYLEWELTKKINLGLDLGFLKDRIVLSANYFVNRTSNQLLSYTEPSTTGFGSIAANFPAIVQNSGLELSLNTRNMETKDFSWTSSFNFTAPHNKLVAFPNLAQSPYNASLVVGYSTGISKLFHYVGVDPANGLYTFLGKDGKPTTAPKSGTDNYAIENTRYPEFYGGFQNSFRYKGFDLDISVNFTKQNVPNIDFGYSFGPGLRQSGNQPITVLNAWHKPGDIATVQKYANGFTVFQGFLNVGNSDAGYTNVTYFRLNNASLSWQIPKTWSQKLALQSIRLFANGQNLFTFGNYEGADPETRQKGVPSTPPLTVLVLGIKVSL
ncbi:TonB-linked outer membrane protein, SusC/RagA family [Pedobacter nyackensis]|uniref:TonB-linked outer membrane protein, SusC/RagA family n=2 Tax=Pedobacter nyackensis TaxID=475255 RepID=A0A1W2A9K0_9SPHI|nr:TonB-linked outer membrane protein, SusC/RagA family [Pedobacter nyackensis]